MCLMVDYATSGIITLSSTAILIAQVTLVIERENYGIFYIRIQIFNLHLLYRQLLLLKRFNSVVSAFA